MNYQLVAGWLLSTAHTLRGVGVEPEVFWCCLVLTHCWALRNHTTWLSGCLLRLLRLKHRLVWMGLCGLADTM